MYVYAFPSSLQTLMHMQSPRGLEEPGTAAVNQHAGNQKLRLALFPPQLFLKMGFGHLRSCIWCRLPWLLFLLKEVNVSTLHSFLHCGYSTGFCSTFLKLAFSFETLALGWMTVMQDKRLARMQEQTVAKGPHSTQLLRNSAEQKRGSERQ